MKNKYVMKNAHILVHAAVYLNVFVFVGLSLLSLPVFAQGNKQRVEQPSITKEVPDIIMVKFRKQAQPALTVNANTADTGVATVDAKISKKNKDVTTEKVVKPSKKAKLNSDLARWTKIKVKNPGKPAIDVNGNTYYPDVDAMIADLKTDPNVEAVEKDTVMKLAAIPNDPFFSSSGNIRSGIADMWGLNSIRAPQAWDTTHGSSSVVTAVIDSGVDYTHPDLVNNMWHNPGEIPNNGIDDDANGYIDDYYGWDFRLHRSDVNDVLGHGTHVAGTIAATGNNGIGISGVSWNSKIMALRICDSNNSCYFSEAAQAMQYATDMGAKVTNNSYGGSMVGYSVPTYLRDAIKYAHDRNVTTVVASMNNYANLISDQGYPANDANAITVGATDELNIKTSFSNYGEKVDIVAPGLSILSTKASVWTYGTASCPAIFGGTYCAISGTSMATPHVTGVIALLYSINPNLTPEQIRQILRTTTLDTNSPGKDLLTGYGLVQADAAVTASVSPNVLVPIISSPTYSTTTILGSGLVTIRGSVSGPNFASYKVEIGQNESPITWTQVASSTTAQPTDTVLATFNSYSFQNANYTFRITATNTDGKTFAFSIYDVRLVSATDITQPTSPANLAGTPSSTSVALSWNAATDTGGSGIQNYIVKRAGVTVGTPTTNSFTDSGLTPSTSYTYSVEAVDYAGNTSGSVSNSFTTLADTTAPSTPTGFVAQTRNKRSIVLDWNSSTDDVAVTGYRIYRGGSLVQTILSNSWTDTGLTINTAYAYGIEAFDAAGNTSIRTTLSTSTLADTTAPTVSFSAPSSGAVLRRQISTIVAASDDEAIAKIELYRGATLVKTLSSSPYTANINLITLTNGGGSLKAVATDTAGNTAESILPVTIANPRRGDITNDNLVNIFDLSSLLGGWNQTDLNKDLDGNDVVNIFDLSILLYEYGK